MPQRAAGDTQGDSVVPLRRDDVVSAYRLLMGRDPESEAVVDAHLAGHPHCVSFLHALLECAEYSQRLLENRAGSRARTENRAAPIGGLAGNHGRVAELLRTALALRWAAVDVAPASAVVAWSVDVPATRTVSHNAIAGWLIPARGEILGASCTVIGAGTTTRLVTALPSRDVFDLYPDHPSARACRFTGLLPIEPLLEGVDFEIFVDVETSAGDRIRIGPVPLTCAAERVCLKISGAPELPDSIELVIATDEPLSGAPHVEGGNAGPWVKDQRQGHETWRAPLPLAPSGELTVPRSARLTGAQGSRLLPVPAPPPLSLSPVPEILGFPECRLFERAAVFRPGSPDVVVPPEPAPPLEGHRSQIGLATVCTVNGLHFARTLAASVRDHHQDLPIMIVVIDAREPIDLGLDGVVTVPGRALGIDRFSFLALKYSAAELCRAVKPFAVRHAAKALGLQRVVYIDADVCVYAPLDGFLKKLESHDFVVLPHAFAPIAGAPRLHERPTSAAGLLNAGMFGVRLNAASEGLLRTMESTGPEAFSATGGASPLEANALSWVLVLHENVHVLRDRAYGVGYWNLHERSLRWTGFDAGADTWTVDAEPLVCFQFSGFDAKTPLSRDDGRYPLYAMPSLARLCETYTERLRAEGAEGYSAEAYGFASFPSGVPIDDRMRAVFRQHEEELYREIDPWTPEGEAHYCEALLSPIPYTRSLIPILLKDIFEGRPDLLAAHPEADLNPERLIFWFARYGTREYGYTALFDRHRPSRPTLAGVAAFAATRRSRPDLFEGLARPRREDRSTLISRLGESEELHQQIASGCDELYYLSAIHAVRQVYTARRDVQEAYPDPLFLDADGFADWLEAHLPSEHGLPSRLGDDFRSRTRGRSLARIFSQCNRNWHLMSTHPLALAGEGRQEFARVLLAMIRGHVEYDAEDVLMYLWIMDEQPWQGIPLTLELAVNLKGQPSSRLPEGQDRLLRPLLERDERYRQALHTFRNAYARTSDAAEEKGIRSLEPSPPDHSMHRRSTAAAPPSMSARPGVNLFGFFKSPIGLGMMTKGLGDALAATGVSVAANTFGNAAMARDLRPEDFVRRFQWGHDTNIIVSYPHLRELILNTLPSYMVSARRNVAYLAWEQRDGAAHWRESYEACEQVWALSSFAAEGLSRALGRPVLTVPCVVDTTRLPPPATKADFGLTGAGVTFLYVFDANSCVERKNPEAAVEAFGRAFGRSREAELVVKVSNAGRLVHRTRLRRLLAHARERDANVRFIFEDYTRDRILRLISAADCYVSLHRAEGFGYTCAEAMAYGRPVIATHYSGNLEFMSPANSFLVDSREVPVTVADGPFQRGSVWADPDVDHAAALMKHVAIDSAGATRIGERGRETVVAQLSPEAIGRRVQEALWGPSTSRALAGPVRSGEGSAHGLGRDSDTSTSFRSPA
jgi:glycosyltransferase involved in cell wall biosynthesis